MGLLQDSDAAREWFAFLAPGYDDVVSELFWSESLQREGIGRLDVDATDRVLDLGCGTGETVRHVQRAADVHGLDPSAPQLQTATGKDELADAHFVQADGHRLPYADEVFDYVVSVGSILYWATPVDVLREAFRVTKPGGSIFVMGFHRRGFSPWNPIQNVQESINATLFYCYDRSEATRLFRTAGWRDEEHVITGPAWSPSLVIATMAHKPA